MQATPLTFPVQPPFWALGELKITREELRLLLGPPHFIETDDSRTFGGDEDCWAFTLPSSHRVLIVLRVPYHAAILYSDPAEMTAPLELLNLKPDDHRLQHYESPVLL